MKFEYFIVLLATVAVPLIRSFSREINFYKNIKRFLAAVLIPFTVFVIIDIISVKRGLWTFNPDYVTGIYLFTLPVEEILFFAVIPFSCLFLWETVKYFERRMKKK
ncbi:MAG: lycopene cyclase domain-containing protein [Ignavibacteria bacterium]|jgi:lycopene cyclase domain-containing protein|nr:lycopene cyclase domain-containing protein [Ignavibacteria bacterium]